MAVYQPSTAVSTSPGEFTATILPEEAVNPITGGTGVTVLKYDLANASTVASVQYVATSKVYTFVDVPYTTDSVAGTNASFNVTSTLNGYVVTLVNGGIDFIETDTVTVVGADIGGATPANNVVITVDAVNTDTGAIISISYAGTQVWPQDYTSTFYIAPGTGTQFIQVNPTTSNDGVYLNITGTDGDSYIQPVTIVG